MPTPTTPPAPTHRPAEDGAPASSPPLWRTPAAVGAAVAVGTVAVAAWNPGDAGQPLCWSQGLLGIDCPFCGGLRCVGALARGDWLAAADHNVVLAVALPLLVVAWAVWTLAAVRGRRVRAPRLPGWSVGLAVVGLTAFTVARNVGGPDWVEWLRSSTWSA